MVISFTQNLLILEKNLSPVEEQSFSYPDKYFTCVFIKIHKLVSNGLSPSTHKKDKIEVRSYCDIMVSTIMWRQDLSQVGAIF